MEEEIIIDIPGTIAVSTLGDKLFVVVKGMDPIVTDKDKLPEVAETFIEALGLEPSDLKGTGLEDLF